MNATGATTKNIRKSNRKKIFNLIYEKNAISKQDIAAQLKISMPTVTQNIAELEKLELIEKTVSSTQPAAERQKLFLLRLRHGLPWEWKSAQRAVQWPLLIYTARLLRNSFLKFPFKIAMNILFSCVKKLTVLSGLRKFQAAKSWDWVLLCRR